MAEVRVSGGHIARATVRKALRASGIRSLKVGFFASARYPDGTPVAAVAAWNEFGTRGGRMGPIPERPFFRDALRTSEDGIRELVRDGVDPATLAVTDSLGDEVGAFVTGQIQRRIVTLIDPPNSPVTIKLKGSSNPLIDTGKMRQAVTWRTKR